MKESMVVAAVTRLDEDKVLNLVRQSLGNGVLPLEIIEEVREGVARVGQLYEQGKYFLADLMMSAEIFKDVMEFLKTDGSMCEQIAAPPIIMGTVRNDIHDIGKNIMLELLQCKGFKVIDLGVDVSPKDFVQAAADHSSRIICMSGLLTVSYESMKLTVHEIEKNIHRSDIKIIIGGLVNEQVRQFVNADYCVRDSSLGLHLCQSLLLQREHVMIS